jgi:hypothetical protein
MADATRRFGLTILNSPTDQLDLKNYKFSEADRLLLDRLLRIAVEEHVHTGTGISISAPGPAILRVMPTGGALPPNATIHYRYSIVDARGQETIASATASATTPVPATAPGYAPRPSLAAGYLEAGEYLYAVSACTRDSSQETLVGPIATATNSNFGGWRLDLPPLPNGGEFFNVYRKAPRDFELFHLATLQPEDRYLIDDGGLTANRFRRAPAGNTTNQTNSIEIELPGPLPVESWTWRIFRTFDPTNWEQSLLDWNGSNHYYLDDGRATRPGFPPATTPAVGGAPKIDLATETVGVPPAAVAAATRQFNLTAENMPEGPGIWRWICEYEHAEFVSMRATVSRTNPPTAGECQIGLDTCDPDSDETDWVSVTDPDTGDVLVSTIAAGESIGELVYASSPPWAGNSARGRKFRLHVHQSGYGPDVVDSHDLMLTVMLRVHNGLSNQTYQWETS